MIGRGFADDIAEFCMMLPSSRGTTGLKIALYIAATSKYGSLVSMRGCIPLQQEGLCMRRELEKGLSGEVRRVLEEVD
jgi:hypothetical protein